MCYKLKFAQVQESSFTSSGVVVDVVVGRVGWAARVPWPGRVALAEVVVGGICEIIS